MAAAKTADVRAAYLGGRSIAAQVRGHHVSRGAICTAVGDLLPYHTASVENALAPELPVTLDMPGTVADCLRITELEPARACHARPGAVRRGQGYTLRTAPPPPYTEGSSPAASRSMAAMGLPASIDEHWARYGGVEPICRLYQSERCRTE
ncbi:resolvase [[Kitasatospora] papulosa]|uniref:resolvase n=1 Tax=[Kitasatospora] papulosa TaxID=1464011 RepID=UPI0036C50B6A